MEDNNKEQGGFSYSYSAREQAEVKKIRDKYTSPSKAEDKMARLRRLDASVTNTAQAVALIFGVIGTLILGVLTGIVGGFLASLAYPVYNATLKAKRKRLAPEIIRLTDELMK